MDLEKVQQVSAVQINFVDDDLTKELPDDLDMLRTFYEERWIDQKKQSTNWLLEGSADGRAYFILADKRRVDTDYSHDFIELDEAKEIRYIKLTVEKLPYGQTPAVAGIRIFGKGSGETPVQASEVIADYDGAMDMDVSWQADGAIGANILWGYKPDKLYHSRLVYGDTKGHIGALVTGQSVYVRVDTFNENGITEGNVITVKG